MNISPKRISKVGIVSFDLSLCNSNKLTSIDSISNVSICEPLRYALDHIIKLYNIDDHHYDNNGIYNDFIDDSINLSLISNDQLCNECNNQLQYPECDMNTANVISLTNNEKLSIGNEFLQLLAEAYKGTKRTDNISKFNISLVGSDDSILMSAEFNNKRDYWSFINILKQNSRGCDHSYAVKCQASRSTNSIDDSTSMLASKKIKEFIGKNVNANLLSSVIDIKGSKINVHDGLETFIINIKDVKALVLEADYEIAKPYMIHISLLSSCPDSDITPLKKQSSLKHVINTDFSDCRICLIGTDNNDSSTLLSKNNSIGKDMSTLSVPVLEEELISERLYSGENHIAVISGCNFAGEKPSIDARESIPFSSFKFDEGCFQKPHNEIYRDILLNTHAHRAVRLVIKGINGLPTNIRGFPPSTYCVAYLIGKKGEKLSFNNAQSRTDVVVQTCDPDFNREMFLQGDALGMEAVDAVVIKIRDSASGIIKDHHIGQVTIPIACFIYQQEAEFCLPLEPPDRLSSFSATMKTLTSTIEHLGEIRLVTQLVTVVDKGDGLVRAADSPMRTDLSRGDGHSPEKSGNSTERNAVLKFSLHAVRTRSTWWPFFTLSGGESNGHIHVGPGYFHVKLAPGSGGLLANSTEALSDGVYIPWDQIDNSVALTETTLLIELRVHHFVSSGANSEKRCMEGEARLLVAPCQSSELKSAILERVNLYNVRTKIKSLSLPLNDSEGTKATDSFSPLKRQLSKDTKLTIKILPEARDILSLLEQVALTIANDAKLNVHEKKRHEGRLYLYLFYLMNICRGFKTINEYSVGTIQSLIELDSKRVQEECPIDEDELSKSFKIRYEYVLELTSNRLRDFILCCYDSLQSNPVNTRDALEELVGGYNNMLRLLIFPYIHNKSSFEQIKGQELKLSIVRLLTDNNRVLEDDIKNATRILGWKHEPQILIIPSPKVLEIIDWYSSCIIYETKSWLSKSISTASKFKTNKFNLPWDVIPAGSLLISDLPEVLRLQLNVYLENCTKNLYDDEDYDNNDLNDKHKDQRELNLLINDKVVDAVGQSFLVMGGEYQRALQMKHWERGSNENGESKAYLDFLVSIVNDAFRVNTVHTCEILVGIRTSSVKPENLLRTIILMYDKIIDTAIKEINKMIFAEIQQEILDFDSLWMNPNNNVIDIITSSLKSSFEVIKGSVEEVYYVKILNTCADTIALRLLFYLKDRALKNHKLSNADLKRFVDDVQKLKTFFLKYNAVNVNIDVLDIPCNLMTWDHDTEEYLSMMQIMKQRCKNAEMTKIVTNFLFLCVSILRPDTDSGIYDLVGIVFQDHDDSNNEEINYDKSFFHIDLLYSFLLRIFKENDESGKSSNPMTPKRTSRHVLKNIREKAADAFLHAPLSATKRKSNELQALNVMRVLGLEEEMLLDGNDDGDDLSDGASSVASSSVTKSSIQEDVHNLEVFVSNVRVRGLKSASFIGRVNPYVAITLGRQRQKTPVVWGASETEWNGTALPFSTSKSKIDYQSLQVKVFDKELVRRKRLIGSVTVTLAGTETRSVESWYALDGGQGVLDGRDGEIYFKITVNKLHNLSP